ncbi:cobalt-precorrin-5B (C(1))-methyltransferase [Alicyclobacillus fastidiosus]|uniref:Cobalt-precorrin-5B C(1)-methyltransferase n=1 Tax=Alicyclobacillus fastidiosus TaxID=392011 RepID=A0ABV5AF23_9BACL|nr:cobalt-precorrin-5B (C(1))-methyltransferase [Alicyclobacillus fastidiosus]WEH12167.1 cobalt-precorrin-5B (C(1))-methyltransferase [Alicyclobacillus fastidiosus]
MLEVPGGPLRHGYTTGACATACTKGALLSLIRQEPVSASRIYIPAGEWVDFQLQDVDVGAHAASATTVKDGGDDPDATHGARIVSTVSWLDAPGVVIDGGIGVGRVTKPGLPIPVGMAAINPVPRKMIQGVVEEVLAEYGVRRGVKVVISVPDGERIAKKTLNERLGILGGISILGTRGIVVPFSTASYKASIAYAMNVAKEQGIRTLVLTTGGRSEKYAMNMFPELPIEAFVEMGDFVGFSAKHAKRTEMAEIRFVGMMGKFSKVAQGVMMVHAKSAPIDFGFLGAIARDVGVPSHLRSQILDANTASQVGDWMLEWGYTRFFERLAYECCAHVLAHIGGGMRISTDLTTLNGDYLGGAHIDG